MISTIDKYSTTKRKLFPCECEPMNFSFEVVNGKRSNRCTTSLPEYSAVVGNAELLH